MAKVLIWFLYREKIMIISQKMKVQTWDDSLMCTVGPSCVYFYICMLMCECGSLYVSMFELVSICILFHSSVCTVWWSLKHGNPGIISYLSPLWSTNENPGGPLLRRRRITRHTLTQTRMHSYAHFTFTHSLNWHQPPICSHYSHTQTLQFTYTYQHTQTYTLSSTHTCIYINIITLNRWYCCRGLL